MITLHLMPTLTDRVTRLRAVVSLHLTTLSAYSNPHVNNLQFPQTLSRLLFGTFSTEFARLH